MVFSLVGQVAAPDLLFALIALVVVLFAARLVLRVVWKVALFALLVVGVSWVAGMPQAVALVP